MTPRSELSLPLVSQIRKDLAARLPWKRMFHVMGVEGLAMHLARQWDVDANKVLMAVLLHDYFKAEPREKLAVMLRAVTDFTISDEDWKNPNIWHGQAAAQFARRELGVTDPDVLEAVFFHTTGIPDYGDVGLCLYVADTLEPTRYFAGVEEMRRSLLHLPMRQAAYEVSRLKLQMLCRKDGSVHSHTEQMNQWLESQL